MKRAMTRKTETERNQAEDANRIAKVMARAGLCSRREAETWIVAGRVAVNGAVINSPALDIGAQDQVTVDGQPLPERERTRLFLYHKPRGLVTTNRDPQGRPTIFDALPPRLPRLVSVGRLDLNSEGLLLMTNDGSLARALELPQTGWLRRYRARALGHVTQAALDKLRDGITVEGVRYGPVEAAVDRDQGANTWLTVGIREGKNREVRNVLGGLGLTVNRLIRVAFGPFELGMLREGGIEEVPTHEIRKAVGEHVLKEADVDLTGPRIERDTPRELPAPRAGRERPVRDRPSRYEKPREDRSDPNRRFGDRKPITRAGAPELNGREEIIGGERVPVKRRLMKHHSDTHVWRGSEPPLRRKYRGDPHGLEAPQGAKKTEIVADRKGRPVTIERYGEKREPPPAEEPRRGRFRNNDRKGKPAGDRKGRPSGDYKRKPEGDHRRKPEGDRWRRPEGDRTGKPEGDRRGRPGGDYKRKPESDHKRKPEGDRWRRPAGDRTDKPEGEAPRAARPRQRRSFDRRNGPRPARPRPKE
jgi:23S rRNA pseudouridine2605 synthase